MSQDSHNNPEKYAVHPAPMPDALADFYREGEAEARADAARYYWRCVPCDLSFDGSDVELYEYGAKCPDCGRKLLEDERTKK